MDSYELMSEVLDKKKKIYDCDRYKCTVGNRNAEIRIETLCDKYRCAECGGKIYAVPKFVDMICSAHTIECASCGEVGSVISANAASLQKILDNRMFLRLSDDLRDKVYPGWRDDPSFSQQPVEDIKSLLY